MIAGTTYERKNGSTCSLLWRSLAPFDQLSTVNRSLANFEGAERYGKKGVSFCVGNGFGAPLPWRNSKGASADKPQTAEITSGKGFGKTNLLP
jgi:hypothetical protein